METFEWTGDVGDEARIAPFLKQPDGPFHPPVCWWLEPTFDGRADLLVTHQLSRDEPTRVRPGQVLARSGDGFTVLPPGRRP